MQPGSYQFTTTTFPGLFLKSYTRLILDPQTLLNIPSNCNSAVFYLKSTDLDEVHDCIIEGGIIRKPKGDTNQAQWTGIQLEASATLPDGNLHGVLFNKFMNITIYDANIGINLLVDGTSGFINVNFFQFLRLWFCKVFVDFEMTVSYTPGSENAGIFRNHFDNIECQSAKMKNEGFDNPYGIKDIKHVGNTFVNVKVWDFLDVPTSPQIPPDGKISNVSVDATDTIIIGGIMARAGFKNTNRNFEDQGVGTLIFDGFQGLKTGVQGLQVKSEKRDSPTTPDIPEKVGFFGTDPSPQQLGIGQASAGSGYGQNEQNMLNTVYASLKKYGLLG